MMIIGVYVYIGLKINSKVIEYLNLVPGSLLMDPKHYFKGTVTVQNEIIDVVKMSRVR